MRGISNSCDDNVVRSEEIGFNESFSNPFAVSVESLVARYGLSKQTNSP